jgi:hypothetical protein
VRVGYASFGRTMKFKPSRWGFAGDAEKAQLLYRLARRNPDVEFVVVGHNDADGKFALPNVTDAWANSRLRAASSPPLPGHYWMPFDTTWTGKPGYWCSEVSSFEDELVELISRLDGMIVHVNQHAPTQLAIPNSNRTWHETFTDPDVHANRTYDSVKCYCRYVVRGLNALGDRTDGHAPVVWICPDPRNYLKARDVKWPNGLDDTLAQYTYERWQRHERYLDRRDPAELGVADWVRTARNGELWEARHRYRHADLELMMLPDDWATWNRAGFDDRSPAGVATTSTKASVLGNKTRRSQQVRDYLLAAYPDAEVYGKWDAASLDDVPPNTVRETTPADFDQLLNRWRVTVSLPIVESGWSVAKPYQCFAAGVLCFYVEQVDDQGWTLPSRRHVAGTKHVGQRGDVALYSVRDDWTHDELTLASWLRVETPAEFAHRATVVAEDAALWQTLTRLQTELVTRRWNQKLLERTIEGRLGLDGRGAADRPADHELHRAGEHAAEDLRDAVANN